MIIYIFSESIPLWCAKWEVHGSNLGDLTHLFHLLSDLALNTIALMEGMVEGAISASWKNTSLKGL
jgi:hypothetical protein